MFESLDDATRWASSDYRGYHTPADIWECKVDEDELMADEYREVSGKYASSWMVYEIAPECLELVSVAAE